MQSAAGTPMSETPFKAHNSPYGSGDPYYSESTGFLGAQSGRRKGMSNWIKFGVPVLIVVIIAAVVGGVVGTRKHNSTTADAQSSQASASSAASAKAAIGIFPTGTNSQYMLPLYPSTTNSAAFTSPTFIAQSDAVKAWPSDPFQPANPAPTNLRTDRPRLIAPSYKWAALPDLIKNDVYMSAWNDTIFGNATDWYSQPVVQYFMDGDSGILDNCRQVKERVKAFAYVYRMTNDTKWVDRTWSELQNAAGNGSQPFGPNNITRWNPSHFLDTAEMTAAYGIAYDWLYDQWSADQKSMIISTMLEYGMGPGVTALTDDPQYWGWWKNNTQGNWNCVCNNGLTMGALAILNDDTSGTAEQLLGLTVPNANDNCVYAVTSDGTWTETANYWYFGTTAHAEMAASLMSAAGSDFGLLTTNPTFSMTGMFHMYVTSPGTLFDWGDHGPNKYSTTANAMLFYGDQYTKPEYTLFQRDQHDVAEPWSMFWYNPEVAGAFWDGRTLDHFFDDGLDQWASMRSSFTDESALAVGIKAGKLQGHQTHNDLDAGDFILDAMGHRWAGELGSGDYRSQGYFSNDNQDSQRWLYYRKRTEGQNTILVGAENQDVTAAPTVTHGSTNETQGSSTVYSVPSDSTAYWVADLTSAYFNVTSFKRGIRTLNARKQVLLQDEINAQAPIMWRMHTNATVSTDGTSATLTLGGETMQISLLNAPSGASFSTMNAERLSTDPAPPEPDQPNPGVTVLTIQLDAGEYTLEVLFNPQWSGMSASDFVTPSSVALDSWSLTSHN
ncbi:heparinase II/III family protein [Heliocybe sulcata]|uniref:Heparinase II/III family protein n=1 Tax=Heliocybe sulcata TaxID=5364 RepID=A0A5C3NI08_9AGAM|nr:heparinase II/III family protein [Heliocybe sulcata]